MTINKVLCKLFTVALVAAFVFTAGAALAEDTLTAKQSIETQAGNKFITTTVTYTGTLTALGFQGFLPEGWSFVSVDPAAAPAVNRVDGKTVEFAWVTVPASPFTFTYTVAAPTDGAYSAQVLFRRGGDENVVPVE